MWLTVLWGSFDFTVSGFFCTYAEHCCFHLLRHCYFQFSTSPRHTEFNLLYLDFSFSEIGVGSAFHRFTFFFAHTLALQVFKLGVWDENLVLHPKLNAQRGFTYVMVAYIYIYINIHIYICR